MKIGEIRPGSEVGSRGYRKSLMIWAECIDCGLTRWVACIGGEPASNRCHPCAAKLGKARGVNIAAYSSVHVTLTHVRGRAAEYTCECGKQAAEWAYTHDDPCPNEMVDDRGMKFSTDLDRYKPMCLRCHRLYDKSTITHCPHGHPYAGENLIMDAGKRKCRTCVYERNAKRRKENPLTPEQKARKLELQRIRRAKGKAANRDVA